MMNVTDYTNIKTLLVKFKEKSDVLYAKAAALSNYATIEWVGTQIPSVGNGTVTIKQNGTSKGSFSMNQSGGATINLTDTTYSSLSAVSGGTDKSLVTTGEKYTWNNKQAAISDLATIRSNAATAYDWGDHSKAGYITGITKAMVETVLTGNITSHTHSYIPLADKGLSNGKVPYYVDFPNYNTLVSLGYNEASTATEDEYYFKGLCKWAIDNFSNQGYIILIGNAQPNSVGYCSIELYSNRPKDADTGLPQYCSGTYLSLNNVTTNFVCRNYRWSWGGIFNGDASTASKWTNARTIILTGSVTGSVSLDGSSNVSLDTTTNHTHTFASLTSKPTTLAGYGITDASRIFRYTIPASGNKGVRITFTSGEPVKITVSGANQGAQLVLIGTGYGEGGFVRNNFTEVVPSDGAYTWCLADEAFSVEIFSIRPEPDMVTVESPSPVTFTAISALSTDAAYRHLLTSANYSSYALPLTGGTIRGLLTITANANYGLTVNSILENSKAAGINFQINGTTYGRVLVKDTKELLYNDMTKTYTVYHAGNANNLSTDWTCKSLVAAGDIKTSGWCKATNGFFIEESGVYYTHHSQFGEIDIVRGNEFIWGGQTDTLYFNYRPSANKTTTVAHYVWNAGSSTTYATHTMGTLTVLGAITATTTIYAKTGIYTDGYISAKQASTSSDRRLKKDFCKIDNALKYVLKTHYTRFRWKDDNKESIGIIAQEEQNREYGFLVQNNEKIGHLTYDYAASTALLGAAIQEEDSKVEKLKKRVAELEKELSNLKRKWQH